jgi:hypothetical protein
MPGKKFTLTVPIDLSAVPEAKGSVKVAVAGQGGKRQIKTVNVEKTGSVSFDFDEMPRGLTVHLGPANAEDDQLDKLRTLRTSVPTNAFINKTAVTIPAIKISATDWHWWLVWCRTFTIRGHVVCPDGSPVPGATVCAYDVDWFWWWLSKQQIGCTTTDEHGAFEMKFTWCCGWWPWYWWHLRAWELDLDLARRLQRVLPVELRDLAPLQPVPKPDLKYLEKFISGAGFAQPIPNIAGSPAKVTLEPEIPIDFMRAELIRKKIVDRLTPADLRIWPWIPWNPWADCNPDIIFRVTQPCAGSDVVIVSEGYGDTRWNVGTTSDVTLLANDKACCERPVLCEGTDCIELTHACGIPRASIGGNDAAHTAPAGYAYPNTLSADPTPDRPFSDTISITGTTDCLAHLDYYEFEFFDGTGWVPMPAGSILGFSRSYFTTGPFTWHHGIPFSPTPVDGHLVFETRQHYEATHGGTSAYHWMDNRDLLGVWSTGPTPTALTWADGTYRIRIRGYNAAPGDHLTPAIDLPPCDPADPRNELILTIDNRLVGAAFHPATHPCGSPNTVHTCTREPDTDILAVRLYRTNGSIESVVPCRRYPFEEIDHLEIDFYAYDPDGHLGGWTLDATYGLNLVSHLTGVGTLSALGGVPGIPAAAQNVSNYRDALTDFPTPATAPIWRGGAYTLRLSPKETQNTFPEPCCYQLELRASKRTIVACSSTLHDNLTEYSFMLG